MSSAGLRAKTGANGIRRFATRALLAVGGAVAGTAVAWMLSTTAAHAADDTQQQIDVVTKIATVDRKLPVVVPAAKVVHKIDETLRAEHDKARAALPQMQVQQTVEKIAERVLPRATFVVTPTTPATSRAMDVTYVPPVVTPEAGQSPVAKVLSKITGPSGATWTKLLQTRHLVVPSEQHPSLPADPSPQLPVPAPAPVQCTCGSDGSGAAGSHKAAFAASGDVHGTSVERALAPSTDEVTVKPGKQPGTTPD